MITDHGEGQAERPHIRPVGLLRFRGVVAVGVIALLVGVVVGAVAIDRPASAATPITVDSFPEALLGETRYDVVLRAGGGFETEVERLDSHFRAQLDGYRFAYGGEGAEFRYGEVYTLTIVNGQLAPEVPISGDPEGATPAVVSLKSRDTSCVSSDTGMRIFGSDVETELPVDPSETNDERNREFGQTLVAIDCVLFDRQRNLSLRLVGHGPSGDVLEAAGQFRDELEKIHAGLTA